MNIELSALQLKSNELDQLKIQFEEQKIMISDLEKKYREEQVLRKKFLF